MSFKLASYRRYHCNSSKISECHFSAFADFKIGSANFADLKFNHLPTSFNIRSFFTLIAKYNLSFASDEPLWVGHSNQKVFEFRIRIKKKFQCGNDL